MAVHGLIYASLVSAVCVLEAWLTKVSYLELPKPAGKKQKYQKYEDVMTDPIADLLTRIRNAYLVSKPEVSLPHSNMKEKLAKILQKYGYLQKVSVTPSKPQPTLNLTLSYIKKLPVVTGIKRLSKPGRRLYVRSNHIKPVLSGQGISIISTSQGLLTDKQAKQKGLGGELVCQVW